MDLKKNSNQKIVEVLIVDDQVLLIEGIKSILRNHHDISVVGSAENGKQAIQLVQQTKPDVILMDISMPGMGGIETTSEILRIDPSAKIIAFSIHSSKKYVSGMLDARASAYLLKDHAPEELITAIKKVAKGDMYLDSSITSVALDNTNSVPKKENTIVIKTKLHRPPITNDIISRLRIAERLEAHSEKPFSLISAPAGYGKSIAVSQWLEITSIKNTWLSLDEEHNNLGLFLLYLKEAIQKIFPSSLKQLDILLQAAELPPVKTISNILLLDLDQIDNVIIPNFFSSLNQSRLGFEVTRKLENTNVFVRLESDFNGSGGQFRIRHAFGQIGKFLVGQTWSLFSNVSSLPGMVDSNGPTGSVTLRTPQVRYRGTNRKGTNWALAMEYSQPDLNTQDFDTTGLTTVQMIPDFTARIEREGILGAVKLSVVLTTISLKDLKNKVTSSFGVGGSLSGTIDLTKQHKILYQFTYGRSISHFITTFSGTGTDAIYNPETGEIESIISFGGFLSYGWNWNKNISTNVSAGYADLSNKDFQLGDAYQKSMSFSLDSFWNIVDGARLGLEYVYGQRWDKDGTTGNASRIWALFYYDF